MSKNNIGLTTSEGVANSAKPFQELAKRNIGLIMERERGVENKAFLVTSQAEDELRFGGYVSTSYGYTVSRNLFKNAKNAPVNVYGVRLIGSASVAANAAPTIGGVVVTYTAAQNGVADKGTWGNNLSVILYSYDYKVRNKFYIEIYYKGVLKETFEGATCALLQADMNAKSNYMMVSFASEIAVPADVTGAGTLTASLSSPNIVGSGTAFDTATKVGTILKNAAGVVIGVVKTVTDATNIILEENAKVAVSAAAYKIYLRYSTSTTLTSGAYTAPANEAAYYPNTDPQAPQGISCFDGVNIQILASTEYHTSTMAVVLRDYCELRKDCIAIINLPLNATSAVKLAYATALQQSTTSFCAVYNVWVKTTDAGTGLVTVPGLGCVLGAAFIRTPYLQGDYIHIPPAGMDSVFVDIVECYPLTMSQANLNIDTRDYTINSVVYKERVGWYVTTSRTMSTNVLYHSVHVRMQTSYYSRILLENLGWVIQKPNTAQLKRELYIALYSFFKGEYAKGALETSVEFEVACEIICDGSNNPIGGDRKELNADINWIPTEAAEAIKLGLNRNDGILTILES